MRRSWREAIETTAEHRAPGVDRGRAARSSEGRGWGGRHPLVSHRRVSAAIVQLENDGTNAAFSRFDGHRVLRVVAELRQAAWIDLLTHAAEESAKVHRLRIYED